MSRAAAPPRAGAEALADNRTGILLMLAATALFSAEDALIKLATATMPAGQVIAALGAGGSVVFALAARRTGTRVLTRDALVPKVLLRNLGEAIAAVGIVTALALSPLSSTLAILQATPLALVAGAGLTLGERVGWRRGVAVAAGFAGVLMIVRPGLAELQPGRSSRLSPWPG